MTGCFIEQKHSAWVDECARN